MDIILYISTLFILRNDAYQFALPKQNFEKIL